MKLKRLTLQNFRSYKNNIEIYFDDFTAFVGRNDIGKSTILEALDLFFNDGKGIIKYDKNDANVSSGTDEYSITCCFDDIPNEVLLDSSYSTSLREEYLLNDNGELEICKKYKAAKCLGIYIRAKYPSNPSCSNLHKCKIKELKKIIETDGIECSNRTICSVMRKSIWQHYAENLELKLTDIDVITGEDTKSIWHEITKILPRYSLFQSDRQNSDGDKEIQDPLKTAVDIILQDEEIQKKLNEVAEEVKKELSDVAERTLEKLHDMDPTVAKSLVPVLPETDSLKWKDVFKNVSITGDENIPINKRGSGVKRLILLNFFRAEAEKRQKSDSNASIIYAIEEPETSQHFSNQKILADALLNLSKSKNTQVIITTHSGAIVKKLDFENIRLIKDNDGGKIVTKISKNVLVYPSLNEVNYVAFGEITEEYHDELYGYIDSNGWMQDYESGKPKIPYIRECKNNTTKKESRTLTHYIRDVLHHPENKNNKKYTEQELEDSIIIMRDYIINKVK